MTLDCLGSTRTASLADVHGPAVINVWSSNCEPCRAEMPALQEFSAEYGDQVNVVGLNFLDTYPGAAIDLAERSEVTYPSLADACGDLQETDLVLVGLPHFLFVAPDGTVKEKKGGVDSVAEIVELTEENTGVDLVDPGGRAGGAG
ncbi:TlpA family protein disulfide reductase [Nocardioides sambongensis]|uniref:TlpA family protein disulfide reductase n=1 Tax=Nocardioides sambongensis TaxID=2589074 RepID=UPI0015E86AA1|nr:TlpA disulfide reductase family protein [Nocardioides sambongensis]